jgi:hypothetical protein
LDGFAVTARESLGASSYNPLSLPLVAVAAGDALPEGTDAVVPLEHGQPDDRGRVVLVEVAAPGATMSTDTVPWPPPGGDLFFASIGHLDDGLKVALAASRPRRSMCCWMQIR